jgi:hypothetical protein
MSSLIAADEEQPDPFLPPSSTVDSRSPFSAEPLESLHRSSSRQHGNEREAAAATGAEGATGLGVRGVGASILGGLLDQPQDGGQRGGRREGEEAYELFSADSAPEEDEHGVRSGGEQDEELGGPPRSM